MKTFTFLLTLGVASLVTQPGCLPDRCKEGSANIELTVEFSGFDKGKARRLEFETRIRPTRYDDTQTERWDYYESRLGGIAWPGAPNDTRRFRIDTGSYLNNRSDEAPDSLSFRVFIRVYGDEGKLLAEGQYHVADISETGCYIEKRTQVTANSTCKNKLEGDPCVSPEGSAASGVCRMEADRLRCRASTCGDGYTDRRAGEICDSSEPGAPCTPDCLNVPLTVQVPYDASGIDVTVGATWEGQDPDAGPVFGYWSVGAQDSQVDRYGTLLAGDLDGDGLDELAMGLPGARRLNHADCNQCSTEDLEEKVGVVYLKDHPFIGTTVYGSPDKGMLNLEGPYTATRPHGHWFGATLASGDVNGDGVADLLVGAPHYSDGDIESGAVYVMFGGPTGAIPTDPQPAHRPMTLESGADYRLLVGEDGETSAGSQPGDHLGYALAVADFDLDGVADIAAAAPHFKVPAITSKGVVYLVPGSPSLRTDSTTPTSIATLQPRRLDANNLENVRLGVSLATGDVNGDGYPDLVMGTTSADAPGFDGGVAVLFGHARFFEAGDAEIFPRSPTESNTPHLVNIKVESGTDLVGLGGTVQAVDVNGDGLDDVVATVGRHGLDGPERPNTVALIDGRFFKQQLADGPDGSVPGPEHLTLITGPASIGFGAVLSAVDVSGDHRRDLIISAPLEAHHGMDAAGSAYVLLSTRRATWWSGDPDTPLELPLTTLRHQSQLGEAAVPLLWIQGGTAGGQLGAALAGSSHLNSTWHDETARYRYTYILEPGANPTGVPQAGRVHTLFLPAALPCEATYPCTIVELSSTQQ